MKKRLKSILKGNYYLYLVYYYLMNFVLTIVGKFIKTNDHIILFESYAGNRYDDSPARIFEKMRSDDKFEDFKFVWVFNNPDEFRVDGSLKIKNDSILFFYYALKSGFWIVNTSIERRLSFKKKKTLCINTWHGTPIKRVGSSVDGELEPFKSKNQMRADVFLTQGDYETNIFSKEYNIKEFEKIGLPRNDILVSPESETVRIKFREKFNLKNKKVVLFAPTFREQSFKNGIVHSNQMDLARKIVSKLPNNYVLLFRAHVEVDVIDHYLESSSRIIDVTAYQNINDLILGSDILVSDYSSLFFDYSLTEKPMIAFTYDFNEYMEYRGLYFDIRKYLPNADKVNDLTSKIKKLLSGEMKSGTISFKNEFVNYYGDATNLAIKMLEDILLKKVR